MKNNVKEIKAVIFDLGNVLIGFDHTIAVKKILKHTPKKSRDIYDLFFDSDLTQEFEKGKTGKLEFFKQVQTALELKISYGEFLPIWNEIFFSKPESEDFVSSLNSGIKLALLSNINQLHYEYIREEFSSTIGLFESDKIIPSFRTGFIKPDKEIYDLALKALGVPRESVVYVDDRLDLIEAALSYGIKSIQFKTTQELQQEFQDLGIIKDAKACRRKK
ncbi:MAG: HAD family phosphatase [Candidatus Omnitrophota bacterium]|nr:HAD family phosphatase [Candidatus Omnitrophota bacterium]